MFTLYYMHWLSIEDASRTTETEQAISQGDDVCRPSSGDPPPHGVTDMRVDTRPPHGVTDMRADTRPPHGVTDMRADTRPPHGVTDMRADTRPPHGVTDMRADTRPPHGVTDMRADTRPPHGGAGMTADTQLSPGVADVRADTQLSTGIAAMRPDTRSSPGVAAMRADTQPSELDSVGRSLRSLQLVEHSAVCDQSTTAVAGQNTPTTATCPVSTVTVTSSIAKLQHAMSNWCTPATWAYLQGDEGVREGGGGGGRGEEKLEPPFLPAVHSVGQAQLQRNIFMQQLKRKSVNHDILVCMNQNDVFNILLSFSLSEIDGCLTGVTANQVLPALTELVRTFK